MRVSAIDGWSRFYVPEIHDVHPGMEAELREMLAVMPLPARDLAALLIVPDWMGSAPLGSNQTFCDMLTALPGEKVLHGWTHSLGPDFLNWLLYGHDNRSEFARLDEGEATDRIAKGLAAFRQIGLGTPRWFCAPRWQQSAAAREALRRAGFAGFMLRDRLELFQDGSVPIPALNFDEGDRKLRNRLMHGLREGTIRRLLAAGRPFRVALHPADVHDQVAWDQVKRVFAYFEQEGWSPLSPDDAIERWKATSPAARAVAA